MSCFSDCPFKVAMDWLEDKHTLHKSVEITYVVDGYDVEMLEQDGARRVGLFHGATLVEAIQNAAKVYPLGKHKSKHEH